MSDIETELDMPLSGPHPEPQQQTNGKTSSNTHELTAEERLAEINRFWEKSDKSDLEKRKAVLAALRDITPIVQPDGAIHLDPEKSESA